MAKSWIEFFCYFIVAVSWLAHFWDGSKEEGKFRNRVMGMLFAIFLWVVWHQLLRLTNPAFGSRLGLDNSLGDI